MTDFTQKDREKLNQLNVLAKDVNNIVNSIDKKNKMDISQSNIQISLCYVGSRIISFIL